MPLSYLQSALSSPFAFLPIAACVALALWVYPIRPREPAAEVSLVSSVPVPAAATAAAAPTSKPSRSPAKLLDLVSTTTTTTTAAVSPCSPLRPFLRSALRAPPLRRAGKTKKAKKSVSFALSQNQTQIVTRWIDKRKHQFSIKRDGTPRVRFCREVIVCHVDNWIVPHGHTQLSFPRTKWIREVPDPELEDWEGDVGMEDC